jgi:hypothetical protein
MRAILRHPKLLGRTPYVLETPKHLPQYLAIRRQNPSIQNLDERFSNVERESLRQLLAFGDDDQEWRDMGKRREWWNGRIREELVLRRLIGKMVGRKLRLGDDDGWRFHGNRIRGKKNSVQSVSNVECR